MFYEAQNKIRIVSLVINLVIVFSILIYFGFIDASIKGWLLVSAITLGASYTGWQFMDSVKNPWLFIPLHAILTIALAIVFTFMLAIGNYAP